MTASLPTITLDVRTDRFALTFTGANGGQHTIHLPVTMQGLVMLYDVLKNREHEPAVVIGKRSEPVQSMIDAFLASGGRIEDEEVRGLRKFKEKYGVDLEELTGESPAVLDTVADSS